MKIRTFFLLLLTAFATQNCGKLKEEVYQIGIDQSFFPLNLGGQAINVFAFSRELLQEISRIKKIELAGLNLSWDNLVESLYLEKAQGILSSAPPNLINNAQFSFSNTYLKTGPVLVVPLQTDPIGLKDLGGKVVAMGKTNEELDLMQNYPSVEFVFYDSIVEALEGTAQGKYSGCLIPILPAHAFLKDLFQNSLMISSDVLTNNALRLVTLKDKEERLIHIFNDGLLELQANGAYDALITKWSLYQ